MCIIIDIVSWIPFRTKYFHIVTKYLAIAVGCNLFLFALIITRMRINEQCIIYLLVNLITIMK